MAAVWSLAVRYTAIGLRLPPEKVDEYAEGVYGFET